MTVQFFDITFTISLAIPISWIQAYSLAEMEVGRWFVDSQGCQQNELVVLSFLCYKVSLTLA